MKIYGKGVFQYRGCGRVIHDFTDGPFDTVNQAYIEEAKRQGLSLGKPLPVVVEEKKEEIPVPKKRGRKPKNERTENDIST